MAVKPESVNPNQACVRRGLKHAHTPLVPQTEAASAFYFGLRVRV